MEDVGRHNAVDKVAGYMFLNKIRSKGKIFYTTGRLTSEMVIKTVQMQLPVLISRSGFTAWGVELARQAGLTLIGRARGARFVALSGIERIVFEYGASKLFFELFFDLFFDYPLGAVEAFLDAKRLRSEHFRVFFDVWRLRKIGRAHV